MVRPGTDLRCKIDMALLISDLVPVGLQDENRIVTKVYGIGLPQDSAVVTA